jgi:hypothetical protein
MILIRPELRHAIWRFRDALFGLAVLLLGLYWAINSFGFIAILGISLVVAGALLAVAGIQRGRFRRGFGGAGVVQVDEGQVTYFGPFHGGSVVIENIEKVELDSTNKFARVWVLFDRAAGPIRIPTDAEGADALFDVFANLEGIETERMLSELQTDHEKPVVIWQAKPARLH